MYAFIGVSVVVGLVVALHQFVDVVSVAAVQDSAVAAAKDARESLESSNRTVRLASVAAHHGSAPSSSWPA